MTSTYRPLSSSGKEIRRLLDAPLRTGFAYRPLNGARQETRLLRLRPAASLDAPLRVRLFHASLDGQAKAALPAYEALSYVWGETWGHHPVWVESDDAGVDDGSGDHDDGDHAKLHPIVVTPNLDTALRHLRYRSDRNDGPAADNDRILWVDALCINQQDPAERSSQVRQMRRIYEACAADVAWLGPDPQPPPKEKAAGEEEDEEDEEDSNSAPAEEKGEATEELTEEARAEAKREKAREKARKAEEERVQRAQDRAEALRSGLGLMRQVADRDSRTLSDMVDAFHEEDFWGTKEPHDGKEFDPDDPGQKRLLSRQQVHSLYATFTTAGLWSRIWIVQELSCAPRVLLAVGRKPADETGNGEAGDDEAGDHGAQARDWITTIDWDKDIVGGFLDDQVYSDAFHSSWGHGTVGPAVASIFSRVRAFQLQRQMMRSGDGDGDGRTDGFLDALEGLEAGAGSTRRARLITPTTTTKRGGPIRNDASLINVLARFKWSHSTDPRDKVYGLLGLVAEAPSLPAVDYTKSVAEVFGDAALTIIQTSGCLDVISQNPFQGEDETRREEEVEEGEEEGSAAGGAATITSSSSPRAPNLPSWVPNFDRNVYSDLYDEFATILFAQRGIYAAGKPDCRHLLPLRAEQGWVTGSKGQRRPIRGLQLRGTVLGRVAAFRQGPWEELGGGYADSHVVLDAVRRWRAAYVGEDDEGRVYAATGEPLWEAFWRTAAADCTAYPIRRLDGEQKAEFGAGLAEACRLREAESRQEDEERRAFAGTDQEWERHNRGRQNWGYNAPSAELMRTLPCERMLTRMLRRWGMGQTTAGPGPDGDGGSLLLMVRATVRAGDVVAVLDGSKVPVVLRAQDLAVEDGSKAYYSYVCPAYVHGFMDGEALAQVADGRLVEQDFVLV